MRRLAFLILNGLTQLVSLLMLDLVFHLDIGHWAHFGGFLTGALLGPILFSHCSTPTGESADDVINTQEYQMSSIQIHLRWISFVLFIALVALAISFNLYTYDQSLTCV